MKTVSIHDAKTNLSKYIATAEHAKPQRKFGRLKNKVWIAQDAFSEELDN